MFLDGPFMQSPFLAFGTMPEDTTESGLWNAMLADVEARIAYTVEIEPWVLADRS